MSTDTSNVNISNLSEVAQADVKMPPIETAALTSSAGVTLQSPQSENLNPPAEYAAANGTDATALAVQPVTTPVSLAPARGISSLNARQHVEFPNRILKLMNPETRITVQVVFRYPPIIAGQSLAHYYDLAEAVILDYRPYSYVEVVLVKQLVDEEWRVLTFGEVQKWLLNAAIGNGLVDELADLDDGPSEDRQNRMRARRRIVFGAISGEPVMIEQLEKNLGVGCLGLNVNSARHIVDDIRGHIFADSIINAALRRRNGVIQQLEKISEGRYQRMQMKKLTAEDIRAMQANLALAEYVNLLINRKRLGDEGSTEGAPAADQALPSAQTPVIAQDKTTTGTK